MSEAIAMPEAMIGEEVFLEKMRDGTVTFEECKKRADLLKDKGYFVVSGFATDHRSRGAEGRFDSQTYDLDDFKKGRVLSKPKDNTSMLMVEFPSGGDKYTAYLYPPFSNIVRPEQYEDL